MFDAQSLARRSPRPRHSSSQPGFFGFGFFGVREAFRWLWLARRSRRGYLLAGAQPAVSAAACPPVGCDMQRQALSATVDAANTRCFLDLEVGGEYGALNSRLRAC